MAQNLVKFRSLTSSQFDAISSKDANTLYFISDTKKIFKGDVEYCASTGVQAGALVLKTALEANAETGVIARPDGFMKGEIYILATEGIFEEARVEAGDLALALCDFDDLLTIPDPGTPEATETTRRGYKGFFVIKSAANIDEAEWQNS